MNIEAIILAGGQGTRLRSVIQDVPKPMAPVANRPFLAYLFDQLCQTGIARVHLSVGYKHRVIIDYFGHRYKHLKLNYVVENEPLGTGGGIRLAMEQCESDHVVVLNGDTYFGVDIDAMVDEHVKSQAGLTMALKHLENVNRYGMVQLDNNQVVRFDEKSESLKTGYINGGIYILDRNRFLERTQASKFSMEVDYMERFIGEEKFCGFPSDAYFIDIGIPEDYNKANQYFEQN
jgi:D-glycero-alpha-D-manno-heptose 1-phosphate guanylyltransferase